MHCENPRINIKFVPYTRKRMDRPLLPEPKLHLWRDDQIYNCTLLSPVELASFDLSVTLLPNYKDVMRCIIDSFLHRFTLMKYVDVVDERELPNPPPTPRIRLVGHESIYVLNEE